MRKNVINKTKKQISLEERLAREQEQLKKIIDAQEARRKKLEDRLRRLISEQFTKNLADFADFTDDELEEIVTAAMQSRECKEKIRTIREADDQA